VNGTSERQRGGQEFGENILKFIVTGIAAEALFGRLLSLVSGNIFVVWMIGIVGLIVGVILGIVHRNDPAVGQLVINRGYNF
jgi:hypothetical protein